MCLIIDIHHLPESVSFPLSVWDLKEYIKNKIASGKESDKTYSPIPSVYVDYGFFNCASTEEHRMLVDLYKDFFVLEVEEKANSRKLHSACVRGRLFAFFTEDLLFKLEPKDVYKRLLKNPYPLPEE